MNFGFPISVTEIVSFRAPLRGKGRLLIALGLLAAIGPAAAAAQEASDRSGIIHLEPPAPDLQRVASLIEQLASQDWSLRQEAADKLVLLGAGVLPALETARRQTPDLQLFSDLELVENRIARDQVHVGRPIWLRLEAADAAAAMREIADQAGVSVQVEDRRLRGVVLDGQIEGLTWWQAMMKLCATHDLDVRASDTGMRITRATDGPSRALAGPISTYGPLLVMARGARYERELAFDRSAVLKRDGSLIADEAALLRQQRFLYDFEMMLEPRLMIGTRRFTIFLTAANDDAGNTLIAGPAADGNDLGRAIDDAAARAAVDPAMTANLLDADFAGGRLRFSASLLYPATPGTRMNLSGRIRGVVGAELHDAEANALDLAAGVIWNVAGERISLRLEASSSAGRWALVVESTRAVTPEIADLLSAAFANAELTDGAGDRFRRGATLNATSDDGRFTSRLEFVGPAEETMLPRTLRCRVPRLALDLDEPFEFANLPMP